MAEKFCNHFETWLSAVNSSKRSLEFEIEVKAERLKRTKNRAFKAGFILTSSD